ncbi:GNAT family N-acetyltransferase [Thalassobius sp. S69A]|uniref:GNAT family N-acetyltransferase n=1 Tax=unclassified Thalassovita TaxID=2619711 RepID=UPI000C0CB00A|nr:GNAT family N-acetyltransferase [Paracoccaceae bacterium]MBT25606.1 GNAT family N-acetyltransferase [Paracoccaceae bacterium]
MTLSISVESPLTPDGLALVDGSEQALRAVYSADECFTFSARELDRPEIIFLVARRNAAAVGCVALVDCGTYGEVKRLFVTPAARGTGAARALMAQLETTSRAQGHTRVMLETGDKLAAAVALYRDLGYAKRGPFGSYADHPASLFMSKPLS